MAWTAPRTWVAGEIPTAAIFNTHLRDNLLGLQPQSATVATSESRSNSAYGALTTAGPAVVVSTGTSALVTVNCRVSSATTTGIAIMGYAVSGATTLAAADATAAGANSGSANQTIWVSNTALVTGLTAGSNTFTAQYRTSDATACSFVFRTITVTAAF